MNFRPLYICTVAAAGLAAALALSVAANFGDPHRNMNPDDGSPHSSTPPLSTLNSKLSSDSPPPAMLPSPEAYTLGAGPAISLASEENSGTGAGVGRAGPLTSETPALHETTPAAVPPSDHQRSAGGDRLILARKALPLLEAKLSLSRVAALLSVSPATLSRLLDLAPGAGAARFTLAEKCRRVLVMPLEALAPGCAPGSISTFAALLKVPKIVAQLDWLYSTTMGASCDQRTNDRRTGSLAFAIRRLGDFPLVPEPLAAQLRAGAQPAPLKRHLKKTWTPEMEAKFRGHKHYATSTVVGRRDLTEELLDGSIVPLAPGRNWVLDDMSSNLPFWFEVGSQLSTQDTLNSGLSPMIARHGCAVGRQGLYCLDLATSAWLGFDLIGRLRDAYQASDILRFFRKLMTTYGVPDRIVIERGVWRARAISGWEARDDGRVIEVEDGAEVPEMAGDQVRQISDGLRGLGVEIVYAYSPRGKSIEGAFNHLQRYVPGFADRGEALNYGRHGGEFEWSEKQQTRARAGVAHARDLGFLHIDRLAEITWAAMLHEGRSPKARRPQPPLEMLAAYLQASPMRPLTQPDLAVFLPEKRSALLRGGVLTAQVDGVLHQFLNPEQFASIGDGARLEYAFDPAEPQIGAAVYGPRGFLCWAEYLPSGPMFSARDRSEDAGPQLLKRYKLAHRTAGRMLDLKSLRTVVVAEDRGTQADVPRGTSVAAGVSPRVEGQVAAASQPQLQRTKDSVAELFGG